MVFRTLIPDWIRRAFTGPEAGQTLVEYGLIISLVSVAAIVGVSLVAGGIDSLWGWIGRDVSNAVDRVIN